MARLLILETGADISRQIFDFKRFFLGELFPNIAATFSVGMIEPKFEKEIQSSFSLKITFLTITLFGKSGYNLTGVL